MSIADYNCSKERLLKVWTSNELMKDIACDVTLKLTENKTVGIFTYFDPLKTNVSINVYDIN